MTPLRALLVNAPFGLIQYPHLGISLIKSVCEQAGFPCDILYATVEFARMIGFPNYSALEGAASPVLLPERVFAETLSSNIPSLDRYFDDLLMHSKTSTTASLLLAGGTRGQIDRDNIKRITTLAQEYVEEATSRPELGRYRVIGFSSSFGQHVASLAMAKRIKERHPETIICFGGANCEGAMGQQLVRSFPFVDYAFSGDGDMAFPLFLRALRDGAPVDIPGVFSRDGDARPDTAPLMRQNLDELPYPDFSDYYAAYDSAPEGRRYARSIPIEGSRGCWWGEKHHCTFCGLNGLTMKYRAKSPERFVAELEYLVERYDQPYVMATDNILDTRYIRDVLPLLKARRPHKSLFFEVKSNLSRAELDAFADAGLLEIQPGIESLSTHVLKLIDKGVTSLQNVQLLKWAEEAGVTVVWVVLCGVPGETTEDYEEMLGLMEKIPHLQPPRGFGQLTIDRFAPYFKWPERWGISIYPAPAYRYVYDLPPDEIERLAFWFCYDHAGGSTRLSRDAPSYARRAMHYRTIWEASYGKVRCTYTVDAQGLVTIEDTRPVAVEDVVALEPLESAVFLETDRAVPVEHVVRTLLERGHAEASRERVQAILDDLEHRMLVHREGDRYLGLPSRITGRQRDPYMGGSANKSYLWRQVERQTAHAGGRS